MKKINYLLRDIPKPLWDKLKHIVIDEGYNSLRDLIIKTLSEKAE